jgi:hypothetical protein
VISIPLKHGIITNIGGEKKKIHGRVLMTTQRDGEANRLSFNVKPGQLPCREKQGGN